MSNTLRAELATFTADAAGMKNPTVLSVGEARGHGFYLDEKSLDAAARLMVGKSLKSYLKHDRAAGPDRTGQEIGYLSQFYREGDKLRAAAFEYFDTFKRNSTALYERLSELTQKIPDALGFSPVISYRPVWVMADGSERPAELGAQPPAGATRNIPTARIVDILSADIVGRPAVNVLGFLSAGEPLVDADAEKQASMQKELEAKVAELSAQVASLDTITKERDAARSELEAKGSELTGAQAKIAELEAAAVKSAETHTAALAAKEDEHKAALAAIEKSHADAIAAKQAELDEAKQFDARKLGVAPLKVAKLQQQQADLSTPEAMLSFYEKMEAGEAKSDFRKRNYSALIEAENKRASSK